MIWAGTGALIAVVAGVALLAHYSGNSSPISPSTDKVTDKQFSQNGKPKEEKGNGSGDVASNLVDEPIVIWRPAKPLDYKKPIILKGHRPGSQVVHMAYAPDGNMLASVSDQGEVILWNLATQQGRVVTRDLHRETSETSRFADGNHVAFSADGKTLFSGSVGETTAWDTESLYGRAKFGSFETNGPMIVSPNGKTLVTERPAIDQARGYGFTIWEVATQKSLFVIDVDQRDFNSLDHFLRYSADGQFLALCQINVENAALAKSAIRIFDLEVNKELTSLPLAASDSRELDARFLSSNRLAVWEGGKETRMTVWNIAGGTASARQEALPADARTRLAQERAVFQFLPKPLSKDGKTMAYVTYPRPKDSTPEIALHDTTTLRTLVSIPGMSPRDFRTIAIGADGKSILASVELEKEEYDDFAWIREYDAATGAKRAVLKLPMNRDRGNRSQQFQPVLATSPTQPATVAAGLEDGIVVIAPLGDTAAKIPKGWKLTAQSPEVVRGDVQLITTAPYGIVKLTAKQRSEFPLHFRFEEGFEGSGKTVPLALARDNGFLAASGTDDFDGYGTVRIWDLSTGKEHWKVQPDSAAGPCQFTPDGRFLIDEFAQAFDLKKKEITKAADDLSPTCLTLTPDGKKLLVGEKYAEGGSAKLLKLLALPKLTVERSTLEFIEGHLTAIKFSEDGRQLAAVLNHQGRSKLLLLDPQTGELRAKLAEYEEPGENAILDFSADGKLLTWMSASRGIEAWDVPAGKLRWQHPAHEHTTHRVLGSGRLIAASHLETTILDAATCNVRSQLTPFDVHERKWIVDHMCPARHMLAIGYDDGEVLVWDLARHGTIAKFTAHPAPVVGITLAADGRTLVTAGKDNKVRVWSLAKTP